MNFTRRLFWRGFCEHTQILSFDQLSFGRRQLINKQIAGFSRSFWCRGYYVDTVGRNKRVIEEYIKNQLEEDYTHDQITFKEYIDPFTGSKN